MSPTARRYFGCILPLTLLIFGCGAAILLSYAGQALIQVERVPDSSMAPLLKPGWTVLINNMAYWADAPERGHIVTVRRPRGWAMRRVVALPGESVEMRDARVWIDGRLRDPGYTPHGRGVDQAPLTLAAEEYFLVADDRDAADSREWGPVARDDIVGLVVFQIDPNRTLHPVLVTATPSPGSGGGVPSATPAATLATRATP